MKTLQLTGLGVLLAFCATAQEDPKFSFAVGGGFVEPYGATGRRLDRGWNIGGSAGYNFTPHIGANIDVGFNSFGINSATLGQIGVPGGSVRMFTATVNPIVHLNPRGKVDVYVTGGGGMYRRTQEFTQPGVSVLTYFDPFFGFYPVAVPTTEVLSSYSVIKPGVNIGAGIAFGALRKGRFFAEARYHHMYMTGSHTNYIPVTFGFRW
jgi:hypothetical protein